MQLLKVISSNLLDLLSLLWELLLTIFQLLAAGSSECNA